MVLNFDTYSLSILVTLNIEKQLLKSEKIMNSGKKRNITMVGRIMIVKSLIIPNITYVASATNIDKEYVSI
jgi:hypothetical protein